MYLSNTIIIPYFALFAWNKCLNVKISKTDMKPLQKNKTESFNSPLFFSHLGSTSNLIAVLSSPSMLISIKAGIQTKSIPWGATKPLAIAIALIA